MRGGHARALQSADGCRDVTRDELAVSAERADADHRVVGVRVDVGDRREVEIHPDLRQLRSDRDRHALGELDVVHYAERPAARIRASFAASSRVTSPPSSSIPMRSSVRSALRSSVSARSWSRLSTFQA